jgi:hypothetical protein
MTDPIDETEPHATPPPSSPTPPAEPIDGSPPARPASPSNPTTSSLRVDPDRKPTDWREPPWFPPKDKPRDRGPSLAALIVGLVLIAIGLYYFLDRTLGIAMPTIRWSTIWPVVLIVIGGLVLLRSVSRRS